MGEPKADGSASEHRLTDTKHIRSWSGGAGDLARLGQIISEQLPAETSFVPGRRSLRSLFLKRTQSAVTRPAHVSIQLTDKQKMSTRGEYLTILEGAEARNIDWPAIDEVVLAAAGSDGEISLSISNSGKVGGNSPGASVDIVGRPRWVPGAMRPIFDELRRKRPWWQILRHPLVIFLAYGSVYVAGMILMSPVGDLVPDSWPDWVLVVVIVAYFVLIIGVLLAIWAIGRSVFPAAEFSQSGIVSNRQKVRRAVASVVGASTVILSIIQSLIKLLENK
jgi:hypothetical protein